jgi:hypothetical protein
MNHTTETIATQDTGLAGGQHSMVTRRRPDHGDPTGPCVWRRSRENRVPHVARVAGQNRVRDQGPCRLNDEYSRGKVQNVRGVVMSGAHPVT